MAMNREERGVIDESQTYDLKTGEVQKGSLMWIPEKPKAAYGRSWFQMAQDTLKIINSHRKELGLEGIVVFNALMARLDFENYIQVSQSEIANELDMQRSNVSRAMSKIVSLGFIKAGPKVGRSHTYMLHPSLAWKGKVKNQWKAESQARRDNWKVIRGGKADQPEQPELQL